VPLSVKVRQINVCRGRVNRLSSCRVAEESDIPLGILTTTVLKEIQ